MIPWYWCVATSFMPATAFHRICDVLVEFEAHRDLLDLVEVKQYLESVLGLPVDITTPSGIRQADRPAILRDLRYAA